MDRNDRRFKISRALWPTGARRAVATGRSAQCRRLLLVKCRWLLRFPDNPRWLAWVSMLLVAGIVATIQAQLWLLYLLAALLLMLITMLLALVTLQAHNHIQPSKHLPSSRRARKYLSAFSGVSTLETPMPDEPPLVRVLETFDLSQVGVEHFLEMPESGDTEELELRWKEVETSQYSGPRKR